ncbi:amidohydrolase [Jatrophihabitans sp. DSM 45814]
MTISEPMLLHSARLNPAAAPQDLLVFEGRIVAIGTDLAARASELCAGAAPSHNPSASLDTIDLDGRFVVPGLWDHHVHFDQWAQAQRRLDLAEARSAAEVVRLVAAHRAAGPGPAQRTSGHGAVSIVGYGFRDALWTDAPHRDLLDEVTGAEPAAMVSGDLHAVWLNSAALALYGLTADPTGLLREGAAMRVLEQLSMVGDDDADQWALEAALAAASRGVVGIVDLEKPWPLDAWTRRVRDGNRNLKVVCGVWTEQLDAAIARGLRTGDVIGDTDALVRMGPFKVITDGSLNTRTAYCHDSYPGLAGSANPTGLLLVPPAELIPLMRKASQAGLQCAVHAIGDHANALAIEAFAETAAAGSIEHAQLLDDADLPRFAELGLIASVQPEHALDDRDVADRLWAGRTNRAFALRALIEAGAQLALGSDAPVAALDPWHAIAAAMHRSRDGRQPWHPEQQISFEQALHASTGGAIGGTGPARATVRAADPADLAILDLDPFTASADQLRSMPVAGTLLNGNWTHRAGI